MYEPFPCHADTGVIDTRQLADLRLLEPGIAIEEFAGRTDRRPQTRDGFKKSEASFIGSIGLIGQQTNQINQRSQRSQRSQIDEMD